MTGLNAFTTSDGILIQDPWVTDNHSKWNTQQLAEWITYLNTNFDIYHQRIIDANVNGMNLKQFISIKYLQSTIGILNISHASAISKAVKHRITSQETTSAIDPAMYNEKENIMNVEQQLEMKAVLHNLSFDHLNKVQMPFSMHHIPNLVSDSNKFRPNGPNRIMYPPKNGPIANIIRYGGNANDLPNIDPFDELTHEIQLKIEIQFSSQLYSLFSRQYRNHMQNVRAFTRNKDINAVIQELKIVSKFEGIFIGDRVCRGPDWKWGAQDGGEKGCRGTIRGIRRWHPKEPKNRVSSIIILWDHGLYGNYRFNYNGAYDILILSRFNFQESSLKAISIGDKVIRSQRNWRWGKQDGGIQEKNEVFDGTIVELYASPAPFEGGARVAVLWDKDIHIWNEKIRKYLAYVDMKENEEMKVSNIHPENVIEDDSESNHFENISMLDSDWETVSESENDFENDIKIEEIENELLPTVTREPGSIIDIIENQNIHLMNDNEEKLDYSKDENQIKNEKNENMNVSKINENEEKEIISGKQVNAPPVAFNLNWLPNVSDKKETPGAITAVESYISHRTDEKLLNIDKYSVLNGNIHLMVENEGIEKNIATDDENSDVEDFNVAVADDNAIYIKEKPFEYQYGMNLKANELQPNIDIMFLQISPMVTDDESEPVIIHNYDENNNKKEITKEISPEPGSVASEAKFHKKNKKRKKKVLKTKKYKNYSPILKKALNQYFKHFDPHITRSVYDLDAIRNVKKNKHMYRHNYSMNKKPMDAETEYDWKEPDFNELLSKPIPKYRWGVQYNYDISIKQVKEFVDKRKYLQIDDRIKRGPDFTPDSVVGDYESDFGIILKVEQWDNTRTEPKSIIGDKVYITWSSFRAFRFNYNGKSDVVFWKRGEVFAHEMTHIRVGDRVERGFSWDPQLFDDEEDGGQNNSIGTVTGVQYLLQITGILAKVQWHSNSHQNIYSWGFKNVYDLKKVVQ